MQNLCDQLAQVARSVSQARPRPPEPISGTRQTQHTHTLNTGLSGAQQAPRSARPAPREVRYCLARLRETMRRIPRPLKHNVLTSGRRPPIPPKGALMQTYCLRATHPYSRRAASRSRTARQASSIPPLTKPSSAISSSSARASFSPDYPPVLGSHPPQYFRSFLAFVGEDFVADVINAHQAFKPLDQKSCRRPFMACTYSM